MQMSLKVGYPEQKSGDEVQVDVAVHISGSRRVNELGEKGERPPGSESGETFFHSPAAATTVLRSCRIIKFLNSGESEVFMYASGGGWLDESLKFSQ